MRSFGVSVAGAGRPVIFIPGLGCAGRIWDETLAHLGGRVEAHVLALSGFAGRPPIAEPLLPAVRDELIGYIASRRLEKPIVVGHSLGGFIAYWVAEAAPDALGGLFIVDQAPSILGLADAAMAERARVEIEALAKRFEAMTPEAFAPAIAQFLAADTTRPEDAERIGAMARRSDARTVAESLRTLFFTDLRPELAKIRAPVRVLVAGADEWSRGVLDSGWRAELAPIPSHELVVVDGARHYVMLDQPAAFFAALDEFLAAH